MKIEPIETIEGVLLAPCGESVLVWLGSKTVVALVGHPKHAALAVDDIVRVNARPELDAESHRKLSCNAGPYRVDSFRLHGPTVREARDQLRRLGAHMFRRFQFSSAI